MTTDTARPVFADFLARIGALVAPPRETTPSDAEFFPDVPAERIARLRWSDFAARKDSFFYAALVRESLRRFGPERLYVDVCAGSGIPFLSAASAPEFAGARWRAELVDADAEAVAIARENVAALGFAPGIVARRARIEDLLASGATREPVILSANPPYVPYPDGPVPPGFLPVAAGPDGLASTLPFLRADYHRDARLVLEVSSLSDPPALVAAIEARFDVEFAVAERISFGRYTRAEPIRSHLEGLRREGRSEFDPETETQTIAGLVLKPKAPARGLLT